MSEFTKLKVQQQLIETLANMGIKVPMPVQQATIPLIIKGRDVFVQSRTGTGKTLCFLIPALQKVDLSKNYPQTLILTPTRELAVQITQQAKKIADNMSVKIVSILGGQDFFDQKAKLDNTAHIIVGTPGRILDHVNKKTLSLGGVNFLVLDEVDEMLQRGFLDDIAQITQLTDQKRQTFVCSATLPQQVADLSKKIMTGAKFVDMSADKILAQDIEQYIVKINPDKKQWSLGEILKNANPYLAIVFCSSRESAVQTFDYLATEGFSCDLLQGDMSQNKRLQVMKSFRQAKIQILVATDLAARGLDVEGVTHIINYDLPQDSQQYIHRVGRTGRAGAKGIAITFYMPQDARKISALETKLGFRFKAQNIAGQEVTRVQKKKAPAKTTAKPATKLSARHSSKPTARNTTKAANKPEVKLDTKLADKAITKNKSDNKRAKLKRTKGKK